MRIERNDTDRGIQASELIHGTIYVMTNGNTSSVYIATDGGILCLPQALMLQLPHFHTSARFLPLAGSVTLRNETPCF